MNTAKRLLPWGVLLVAGGFFFGRWGFLAGCAVLVVEEWFSHVKDVEAMANANEVILAQRTDAAESLSVQVKAFEDRLKILETPERLQATKEILNRFKEVIPGMRR